jgi:MFS family permease
MKPATQPILHRFGFRVVLIVNGVLAAGFIGICAAFQPAWPSLVLDAVLFVSGFFRSLQFTAFNAIAYGDVPRSRMSAATTFYSTIQQLTLTLGIVIGAATLEISARLHHHATAFRADYAAAFILVAAVAFLAVPLCARLKSDAGEALSGHHTH